MRSLREFRPLCTSWKSDPLKSFFIVVLNGDVVVSSDQDAPSCGKLWDRQMSDQQGSLVSCESGSCLTPPAGATMVPDGYPLMQ
jgi:hypothetical protein